MSTRRALHFVFKIGNRTSTVHFLKDILGMKVLRHEEFNEGCQAACNGPYDNRWSKTMIGYGLEDTHFVIELTYNYGIGSYKFGDDFRNIRIEHKPAFQRILAGEWPIKNKLNLNTVEVVAPGGYPFVVCNVEPKGDPIKSVTLSSSNLSRSADYWSNLCGMQLLSRDSSEAELCYMPDQCHLELVSIPNAVDHASAYGRIAFSCPRRELSDIQNRMEKDKQTILTPLISLDTPGKATVEVVILADPDGHEICFVGDEAFRELSQTDPEADKLLSEAIAADKSDSWFARTGREKQTA